MTECNVSKRKNAPIEYDVDENLKKRTCIKSETEYSQETDYGTSSHDTRDIATEACAETDNVYITAEIYSMTNIPSSLQRDEDTPPKPGMIVPEYRDGKCMILRAYRCKAVNTDDANDLPESNLALKCIFPSANFKEKLDRFAMRIDEVRKNFEAEKLHGNPENRLAISLPMCKQTCPNLVKSQISQTDGALDEYAEKPKEHGDSRRISVAVRSTINVTQADGETIYTQGVAVSMVNQVKGKLKPGAQVSLTTIQELEEKPMDDEETEGDAEGIVDEDADEDEYEDVDEDAYEGIDEEEQIFETQDAAVDAPDMQSTAVVSEATSFDEQTMATASERDKVTGRKASAYRYDIGTIITSHSTTWLDRPKRRIDCREICARTSESICCASRFSDDIVCCTEFVHPSTNQSMVQCGIVRGDAKPSCSVINQPVISCDYFERCNPCSRRLESRTRFCETDAACWRDPSKFWSTDHWSSKSNPTFGSFQEAFMRNSFCRVNNNQRCSMARETLENCMQNRSFRNNACNQYYLNFNKGHTTMGGGHCACNNGYSMRNPSMYYCAARNQTVYCTPTRYYHSFNMWY